MVHGIRKAAVLGAGVMGAQIAALLASVGIPTDLLDIVPDGAADRDVLARSALEKLRKMKPAPMYTAGALELIRPGNLEDHLGRLAEADWVVEAIVESLPIKEQLWRKAAPHLRPDAIVSSNTSGLSIAAMAAQLPEGLRSRFMGTHFFNPPRYLRLLELIPGPGTDPALVQEFAEWATVHLGKGVVIGRDTPYFIANRIGTYGFAVTMQVMAEQGLGVDAVESITGPALGRPKSATFRTLDLVGLDTMLHVLRNLAELVPDPAERATYAVTPYLDEMAKRGWLGEKVKQGFFRKQGDEILTLDLATLEYGPRKKARFPSLDAARNIDDVSRRIASIVWADDPAGRFTWAVFQRTLPFTAALVGEIADDIVSVDRAMRWGFGHAMGPFEAWDAIGVRRSVERMEAAGAAIPPLVRGLLDSGHETFYREENGVRLYWAGDGRWAPVPADPRHILIRRLKDQGRTVKASPGASLVDLGDGVLCAELHSPKNAIGPDIIMMLQEAVRELRTGPWKGLVIANESDNFAVGANLFLMLMAVQEEEWSQVEQLGRGGQYAFLDLKRVDKPVVVAMSGLALGGGCEIPLHADVVVAHAETYMGLVEVATAGILPAWGGCKEMLIRNVSRALVPTPGGLGGAPDLQPYVNKAFETIAMAKVSTSAAEALDLGYLRPTDRIIMNRDHLVWAARETVLELDRLGYTPPQPARIPVVGPDGRAVLEYAVYAMHNGGYASEHDVFITRHVARVLTGGDLPAGSVATEEYLLALEREAFLALARQPKSQARMAHVLQTGKPLRN